jgi:5-methylcytosine-specific restriction endonuclease McrA
MKTRIHKTASLWCSYPRHLPLNKNSIKAEAWHVGDSEYVYFLLYAVDLNLILLKTLVFLKDKCVCAFCEKPATDDFKKCSCSPSKKNITGYPLYKVANDDWDFFGAFKKGLWAQERKRDQARWRLKREKEAEGKHTKRDVENIWIKQNGKCFYCESLLGDNFLTGKYHLDHRISLSSGGSNWPKNIVLACGKCNLSKGTQDPVLFKSKMKRRRAGLLLKLENKKAPKKDLRGFEN